MQQSSEALPDARQRPVYQSRMPGLFDFRHVDGMELHRSASQIRRSVRGDRAAAAIPSSFATKPALAAVLPARSQPVGDQHHGYVR